MFKASKYELELENDVDKSEAFCLLPYALIWFFPKSYSRQNIGNKNSIVQRSQEPQWVDWKNWSREQMSIKVHCWISYRYGKLGSNGLCGAFERLWVLEELSTQASGDLFKWWIWYGHHVDFLYYNKNCLQNMILPCRKILRAIGE